MDVFNDNILNDNNAMEWVFFLQFRKRFSIDGGFFFDSLSIYVLGEIVSMSRRTEQSTLF